MEASLINSLAILCMASLLHACETGPTRQFKGTALELYNRWPAKMSGPNEAAMWKALTTSKQFRKQLFRGRRIGVMSIREEIELEQEREGKE